MSVFERYIIQIKKLNVSIFIINFSYRNAESQDSWQEKRQRLLIKEERGNRLEDEQVYEIKENLINQRLKDEKKI